MEEQVLRIAKEVATPQVVDTQNVIPSKFIYSLRERRPHQLIP